MLFVALLKTRRLGWEYPEGVDVLAEYWLEPARRGWSRSWRQIAWPRSGRSGCTKATSSTEALLTIPLSATFHLQNSILRRWAMLGSNQRPLPCEGSALPLS